MAKWSLLACFHASSTPLALLTNEASYTRPGFIDRRWVVLLGQRSGVLLKSDAALTPVVTQPLSAAGDRLMLAGHHPSTHGPVEGLPPARRSQWPPLIAQSRLPRAAVCCPEDLIVSNFS
ncbi:uncharacterized protein BDR25DRAFT_342842 [Lindgomyces ingoldianus]|uniref:Uncharacterized protein n=1 Tax=Lindgomyces ingoldianus TaxID=673940 RepID=A0ACB6QY07_9PLEO|nr:uncharacterized protein BDR25DRAFT_342842 [Lindgomyces ingoldianus]KAF2471081.1 hypothetical protein BDR25DRAFT_342842 [Lindgomyces ingoldianus]